jgi:hypothetical protein
MTAFAFGRLARVNVFHHSPCDSVTLEHPCRFYHHSPRDETYSGMSRPPPEGRTGGTGSGAVVVRLCHAAPYES